MSGPASCDAVIRYSIENEMQWFTSFYTYFCFLFQTTKATIKEQDVLNGVHFMTKLNNSGVASICPLGIAGYRCKQITAQRRCQNFQEFSAEKD